MLVISENLVLSDEDEALPDGTPLILWQNLVTISNISADSEDDQYPATNLANPATNLEWRGTSDSPVPTEVKIDIALNSITLVDGVGIARHNFGSEGIAVSIYNNDVGDSFEKVLLHFNEDSTDSNSGGSAHTWSASGNAQIDTAQSKFGGASALFDGSGDWFSTPDHADFTLASLDWTLDFWFMRAGSGAIFICGQSDNAGTPSTMSLHVQTTAGNVIQATATEVGPSFKTITGTTQFTNVINPGWHHFAFVRTGNVLKMFIDGVQEGGDLAITGAVINSTNNWAVGTSGENTATPWNGWLDEFRLSVGVARWTSNFTVPTLEYNLSLLAGPQIPPDDEPLLFQFTPTSFVALKIQLDVPSGVVPRAAVVYAGPMLIAERGFDVGVDFTPPHFARKTDSVNGMSHAGDFLGRIITSQSIDGATATWRHFTPGWYRQEFDPFVAAAQTDTPFFIAWAPDDYPYEVAYAWLLDDPYPVVSPITGRMAVSLKMGGIVG